MTEAREIEEIVAALEAGPLSLNYYYAKVDGIALLIADWRAKKAEIERLTASIRAQDAKQSQTAQSP